jgi:signal transduction histidine kinase/FixJ family two-component response regulator
MSTSELGFLKIRVLLVEDSEDDAALLARHLAHNGLAPETTRVETAAEMEAVLRGPDLPDIVLADYNLPTFSGPAALQLLKTNGLDLPFIMLSGAVSEEIAVSSLRAGAHDYVSKQNFSRLVPAIYRELKEAETRRNRIAAERALRASEARFHSLVEAMPLGLLISDADGHITYANRSVARVLHYPDNSPLSGSVTMAGICPVLVDGLATHFDGAVTHEPFEAACTAHDGSNVEVLIGVAQLDPSAPPAERQFAVFIVDLSMQKKSEEVLRRTEKLAVVGRLAASVAHEINNPLEAVTNCLYLVAQEELPGNARTYLELAQNELDRVTQITVQTLRYYRASSRAVSTNVHDLIATVLALLEWRLRQLQVEVVRQFRMDRMVLVRDGEIRQVLANLIGNAIDAVPEGGRIIIRTSNARDHKSNRDGIAITVADNGTGISPAAYHRIFEPFFSTKESTGTGLGLWVSQEIALKHQGSIHVRSSQGPSGKGGTVFRFFLPLVESMPEENPTAE